MQKNRECCVLGRFELGCLSLREKRWARSGVAAKERRKLMLLYGNGVDEGALSVDWTGDVEIGKVALLRKRVPVKA